MQSQTIVLIAAAALLCGAGAVDAAEATAPDRFHWSLGGGVVSAPNIYDGVGSTILPVPLVNLSYGHFHMEGVTAGFRWREQGPVQLDLFVSPRFLGFNADDSDALEGMDDRELSLDLGGRATYRSGRLEIELSVLTDILGRSGGQEIDLVARVPLTLGKWRLSPGAGPQRWSADFVDYYFGVSADEARPGRPVYTGSSTINWSGGLFAVRRIGQRWSFLANLAIKRLGREVRDSPIVAGSTSESGFAGFLYTF